MRIAVPIAAGFGDLEFSIPRDRLNDAGHDLVLIGTRAGDAVTGKQGAVQAVVDVAARQVQPDDFDALLIPGGQAPDALRLDRALVRFVRDFMATGKPVAAICHGPKLLIEANAVSGRTVTSWPSVRTDLVNAGADWINASVVQDGNLVTSRKPGDLDAFCNALLRKLAGTAAT